MYFESFLNYINFFYIFFRWGWVCKVEVVGVICKNVVIVMINFYLGYFFYYSFMGFGFLVLGLILFLVVGNFLKYKLDFVIFYIVYENFGWFFSVLRIKF